MPRTEALLPEEMWKEKWKRQAKAWKVVSFLGIEKDKGKVSGRGGTERKWV